MIHIDPSAPSTLQAASLNRELSVEEVALIEQTNQEIGFTDDLTTGEVQTKLTQNIEQAGGIAAEINESLAVKMPDVEQLQDQQNNSALKIRLLKRKVSGRYSNCPRPWKLELRVDVDGVRPGKSVSGDFYYNAGSTTSYFGSFKINAPNIYVSNSQVTLIGIADTTWPTSYKKVRIAIPRHNIYQPAANAVTQWYTLTNKRGASYTCLYESAYFRTLQIEEDREQGVTPFQLYDTALLASGGSNRKLSVASAYEEAGLQIQSSASSNVIPTSEANADHKWNNAELHDAMEKHFSLWQNEPGFKAWLFHANAHEYGSGLLGIMFDQKGKQRQGCASFYQTIDTNSAADLRTQLYVNVHELGHCFNLFHSFHKKYMNPPMPNRPNALSWMNYPNYYPGGASAFWQAFPFEFDDLELAHLRHAFRNDISMGANPFGDGAAARSGQHFMDNVTDDTGLQVSIQAPHFIQLGTPVHVGLTVSNISNQPRKVFLDLHPNNGLLQISLKKPNGAIVNYHPPMTQLVMPKSTYLKPSQKIEDTCYIGFDAEDGQIFDAPGSYQLFATYYCPDGSAIQSVASQINVSAPRTLDEETIADLMLGNEQGMLFFLEGSDSEYLKAGNAAFSELTDRFADHSMATYIHLIEGIKASRSFMQIDTELKVKVKNGNISVSRKLLNNIMDNEADIRGVTPQVVTLARKRLDGIENASKQNKVS
jgi:hypothetical protein